MPGVREQENIVDVLASALRQQQDREVAAIAASAKLKDELLAKQRLYGQFHDLDRGPIDQASLAAANDAAVKAKMAKNLQAAADAEALRASNNKKFFATEADAANDAIQKAKNANNSSAIKAAEQVANAVKARLEEATTLSDAAKNKAAAAAAKFEKVQKGADDAKEKASNILNDTFPQAFHGASNEGEQASISPSIIQQTIDAGNALLKKLEAGGNAKDAETIRVRIKEYEAEKEEAKQKLADLRIKVDQGKSAFDIAKDLADQEAALKDSRAKEDEIKKNLVEENKKLEAEQKKVDDAKAKEATVAAEKEQAAKKALADKVDATRKAAEAASANKAAAAENAELDKEIAAAEKELAASEKALAATQSEEAAAIAKEAAASDARFNALKAINAEFDKVAAAEAVATAKALAAAALTQGTADSYQGPSQKPPISRPGQGKPTVGTGGGGRPTSSLGTGSGANVTGNTRPGHLSDRPGAFTNLLNSNGGIGISLGAPAKVPGPDQNPPIDPHSAPSVYK